MVKFLSVLSAAGLALVLGAASPASAADRSVGVTQEKAQAAPEVSSQRRRFRRSAGWRRGYHGGRRGYYRPYYGYRSHYRPYYGYYRPYYRPYYSGYGYGYPYGGYGYYRPRPFVSFGFGPW